MTASRVPLSVLNELEAARTLALTIRTGYPSLPTLEQNGCDVLARWSDGASASWVECQDSEDAALIVAAVNALPGLLAAVRAVVELLAKWDELIDHYDVPETAPLHQSATELRDTLSSALGAEGAGT